MKKCTKCEKKKSLDEFHVDRRAKDGRLTRCKPCQLAASKASYEKHRQKRIEQSRRYQREHPEKRAASRKAWEKKNPERIRAIRKRYRERHKAKLSADYKRWYTQNRIAKLGYSADYREENRATIYARRNMEKHREYGRKRRALLADAYVEAVIEDEIIKRDCGLCGICGDPVMGPLEIDHIQAISRNGTHEPANVQLAHKTCNRRKWANAQPR